ncbi:MAG: hypothetical protein MK364_22040, partial [Pirellulales bacterium]|nr:hypothetical protein [Pirellulales bacterium]
PCPNRGVRQAASGGTQRTARIALTLMLLKRHRAGSSQAPIIDHKKRAVEHPLDSPAVIRTKTPGFQT